MRAWQQANPPSLAIKHPVNGVTGPLAGRFPHTPAQPGLRAVNRTLTPATQNRPLGTGPLHSRCSSRMLPS